MNFTAEQVLSLAPNPQNAARGQKLASPSKWSNAGIDPAAGEFLWGECKGSGSKPYRTSIDLSGPAFKCSCPSREFPCKHGVGLFLLFVSNPALFTAETIPEWTESWISGRRKKEAAKSSAPEDSANPSPSDEEKLEKAKAEKEKRESKRLHNIASGIEMLDRWIATLLQQGLGSMDTSPGIWEEQARRMVDAQAPGIANRLREIPACFHREDWMDLVLRQLAEIHLINQTFRNREQLPDSIVADLYDWLGINQKKGEILALPGQEDDWTVLAVEVETNDLVTRKTWLYGKNTDQFALILDFAHGNSGFDIPYVAGHRFSAEIVYYPSHKPLRSIIRSKKATKIKPSEIPGIPAIDSFLGEYAQNLALNPLLQDYPVILDEIRPLIEGDQLLLVDSVGKAIPAFLGSVEGSGSKKTWKILSISGGKPIRLFGNWRKNKFHALSVILNDKSYAL